MPIVWKRQIGLRPPDFMSSHFRGPKPEPQTEGTTAGQGLSVPKASDGSTAIEARASPVTTVHDLLPEMNFLSENGDSPSAGPPTTCHSKWAGRLAPTEEERGDPPFTISLIKCIQINYFISYKLRLTVPNGYLIFLALLYESSRNAKIRGSVKSFGVEESVLRN